MHTFCYQRGLREVWELYVGKLVLAEDVETLSPVHIGIPITSADNHECRKFLEKTEVRIPSPLCTPSSRPACLDIDISCYPFISSAHGDFGGYTPFAALSH